MTNLNDFSNKLKEEILKAKSIAIISHYLPDGDAIGSTLTMYGAVRKLNNAVTALRSDTIPTFLKFLPLIDDLILYDEKSKFDLAIILDCGDEDRLGSKKSIIKNSKTSFLIDHHNNNPLFANYNYVDNKASSTCELVFDIVKLMGVSFCKDMAFSCLTGILTDTNRFMYENSSSSTLLKAAELIDTGLDKDYLIRNLYQKTSKQSFLINKILVENTEFFFDGKFAFSYISNEDLNKVGATRDDLDDKISLIRDIEGVEIAILVEDRFDELKVGLRSKEYVNVSELARRFGGGGHNKASGFYYKSSIIDLKRSYERNRNNLKWK